MSCTSLTSVMLPASLTRVDSDVFEGCTLLVSLTIPPSLTTISTTSSPDWFKHFLVEAGFSSENPNDILSGQATIRNPHPYVRKNHYCYYNLEIWAQTIGADGKLPLVTAARKSLKWKYMKQIFTANMPAIYQIDSRSGLPLFMLAAAGPTSNIESVYNLLKDFPGSISVSKSKLLIKTSTDSTTKRKRGVSYYELSRAKLR